jgi:hypothetical protein
MRSLKEWTLRPRRLSSPTRHILLYLARVAMPAGQRVPAPDMSTIARFDDFLATQPSMVRLGFEALIHTFQQTARLRYGRSFTHLSPSSKMAFLNDLFDGSYPQRMLLRVLLTPLKVAHYDDPDLFAEAGCIYRTEPVREVEPRYLQRAQDGASFAAHETLEAEVVIVGSGAGGAALAAELAEMGLAVVVIEEGGYLRRQDFSGRPAEMMSAMYRDMGATVTLGNCSIPTPVGRCVGGTTAINSGTCYRVPPWVLHNWSHEEGLTDFTPEALDPYFQKVEQVLQVAPADLKYIGGIAAVMARGCEALGYTHHGPLLRNAPDCDGASLCVFGCPTDAKRSTNVSYIPLALRLGATLVYNARVTRILLEGGRATGVEAQTSAGRPLTVRASAVVLSAGALMTPTLLLRQNLANNSKQVGRNLSVHPALNMIGLFPQDSIRGYACIPQGYGIEEFHREGLLFEGVYMPLDIGAGGVTCFGPRYTEIMEAYEHIASFGFLIEDTSRGRVRLGPKGMPLMTYVLNDHDVAQLKRGLEILTRIFLAAGAETVLPLVPGFTEIRDQRDLERFHRARFHARDFELTAYHPLGTARMGLNPASSVVGPTHETHEVPGLFICDGSAVPSSLGVNPQLTIMALATRAAQFVARAVEQANAGAGG